jgi:hypothetical protein
MENNDRVKRYFKQRNFSVAEIIFLIVAIISGFLATFVRNGIVFSTPLLVSIICFAICRSTKVKDDEVDQILKKIMQENKIECNENTIVGYDYKQTLLKKRKDGKIVSPKYYITNFIFSHSGDIVLHNWIIDLMAGSATKNSFILTNDEKIELIEESINTHIGIKKVFYILVKGCDYPIPITISDYNSSLLLEKVCAKNEK